MPFKINANTIFPIFIPDATETAAGVMSIADKIKLDGLSPGGGMAWNVTAVQGSGDTYSAAPNDFVPCNVALGGNVGVVLPSAVGIAGQMVAVKDVGGNATSASIKVTTTDGQTIDGQAVPFGLSLGTINRSNDFSSAVFVSDGANWLIAYAYMGQPNI